jgi:UDP-N-acetylmuramyl pentapeptide phosphotransferase/UDP-N-acetylglucosamine-1-phosphate transferase
MFLSFWNVLQAVLFALGVVWCKEIFPKWREHIRELQIGNWPDRTAIILLWGLTVLIALCGLHFIYIICKPIFRSIHDLM